MEILPENVDDITEQVLLMSLEVSRRAMSTPNRTVSISTGVRKCEAGGYHAVFQVDDTPLWTHIHWPNFGEAQAFEMQVFNDVTDCMNDLAVLTTVIRNN